MKIHVSFDTPEAQNTILDPNREADLFAALTSANEQLANGKTSGTFQDASGTTVGKWALEITADDLRVGSATAMVAGSELDEARLRNDMDTLGRDYVDFVLARFDRGEDYSVMSALDAEHPGGVRWDSPKEQQRSDVRSIAELEAETGPKGYTFRDEFRHHLMMSDDLPANANVLFNC